MRHTISGTVIHGDALGRKLWFPTANIAFSSDELPSAVFKVNIEIDGHVYAWMWVYAMWKDTFEVHIFDFDADIYGEHVQVFIWPEIRKNKKFDSLEDLSTQLQKDKETIQSTQTSVMTFWSFDVVHEWHKYYLSQAKKYWDSLITIVASDETIQHIKWRPPQNTQAQRIQDIQALWLVDTVITGSKTSPFQWLEKYAPEIIALGYDQRWKLVESLPNELQRLWLNTKIVRIPPLEPEKYKSSILKKDMNDDITYRKFEKIDFTEYKKWYQDAELNKYLWPMDSDWLEAVLSETDWCEYSFFRNWKLIGVVWIKFPKQDTSYYITDFAINPQFKKKGLGSQVLRKVFDIHPLKPDEIWTTFVSEKNTIAKSFFEKNWFVYSSNKLNEMMKLIYRL